MGSGLALSPKGCQFYLFPDTALKACSVRSKSQKDFVGHVHQNMSGFAKKEWKEIVTKHCLIFSDTSDKMSSLEKTPVHDTTHKQILPRPHEGSSGEHKL